MWRSLASNLLTLLVVLLFSAGGALLWGKAEYAGPGPLEQAICLQVKSGTNMNAVSRELVAKDAVSSGTIFRIGARYSDKANRLKAGSFLIDEGASMEQIVDQITRGGASTCGTEIVYRVGIARTNVQVRELDPATEEFVTRADFNLADEEKPEVYATKLSESDTRYRITMAEGVTSWQVVQALNSMEMLTGEIAVQPTEGTLAPDNYEIEAGTERAALVEKMLSEQSVRIAEAWAGRNADLPISTPEEMLILASIIEKETGIAEERRLVASVFVNRLNRGMRLQTDPTVIYGITKGKGILGRGLRQSELRKVTPWNTYVIDGLPPTPIANPGLASLKAAVNPEDSNFVFFVADGTGGHAFAATLQEHNRNVAKWREIEAQRDN